MFFGKRGFGHFGMQFAWRITAEEKQAESIKNPTKYVSELHTLFIDLLTDDSSEDAFAASRMFEHGLIEFKKRCSHITNASLVTDGAGYFSGTSFCTRLGIYVYCLNGCT
jgi:hypothetical protein